MAIKVMKMMETGGERKEKKETKDQKSGFEFLFILKKKTKEDRYGIIIEETLG